MDVPLGDDEGVRDVRRVVDREAEGDGQEDRRRRLDGLQGEGRKEGLISLQPNRLNRGTPLRDYGITPKNTYNWRSLFEKKGGLLRLCRY